MFNAEGYLEVIEKSVLASEHTLQLFAPYHAVIYSKYYLTIYGLLVGGYILKLVRDGAIPTDSQDKLQALLIASLVGLLMLPVSLQESHGVDGKGAFIYRESTNIFHGVMKLMTGTVKNSLSKLFDEDAKSNSPLLRMYQDSTIKSLLKALDDSQAMRPFYEYKYTCERQINQNVALDQSHKKAFGFSGSSPLGYFNTLRLTLERELGNSTQNTSIESIYSAIANKTVIPNIMIKTGYTIPNGIFIKSKIKADQVNEPYSPLISPYITNGSPSSFVADNVIPFESNLASQHYNLGVAEYKEYVNERINKGNYGSELEETLTGEQGPLSAIRDRDQANILYPIDCVSFAMIVNMVMGQFAIGVSNNLILQFDTSTGNDDLLEENYYAARVAAVEMASVSILSSYSTDLEKINSSSQAAIDTGVATYLTAVDAKNRVVESFQMDVMVPIIFYGSTLLMGFLLAIIPIAIAGSTLFPEGNTFIFEYAKLLILLTLNLALTQIAITYIDFQLTKTVNDYTLATLGTGSGDSNQMIMQGDQTLSAMVLAANESTSYALVIASVISYGVVYDFRALMLFKGVRTGQGNAARGGASKAVNSGKSKAIQKSTGRR